MAARSSTAHTAPPPWVARAPSYAGCVAGTIGLLVLVGWLRHFVLLGEVLSWLPWMKANAALAVVLAGGSLLGWRHVRWLALGPLAIGAATLLEWTTGHDLGIDQLLTQDTFASHEPGRACPQTATALVLFATARLLTPPRAGRPGAAGGVMTLVFGGVALVLDLGWVFRAPELISSSSGAGIDAPGAICIGLLALGLTALHAHHRPLVYLWDTGLAGTVVRRLLPAVLIGPPLLGLVHVAGQDLGWYGLNLGTAGLTGSVMVLLALVVTVTARSIQRLERESTRVTRELEAIFDSVPAALTMRDPRGRLLRYNRPPTMSEGPAAGDVYFRPPIRDDDQLLPTEVEALTTGRPVTTMLKGQGNGREYQATKFPVYDTDGSVLGIGGFAVDVTARIVAEQEATRAVQRLRGYLDAAPDATVIVDEVGVIRYANHQVTELLGYAPDEMLGRPVEEVIPPVARERHKRLRETYFAHPVRRALGSGLELTAEHRDGHSIPVEISLGPVPSDDGLWVAAAIRDVTARREVEHALREAEQRARHLADHDPLTGIWNRRRFEGELELLLARLAGGGVAEGALMIVDVDHFKQVNDGSGHHAGDGLLTEVADRLSEVVRHTGAVSRIGGDEFALLIRRGEPTEVSVVATAVAEAVAAAGAACGLQVTGSVGVAAFADLGPAEFTTRTTLMRADEALYAAKRAGRGRYVLYVPGISRSV